MAWELSKWTSSRWSVSRCLLFARLLQVCATLVTAVMNGFLLVYIDINNLGLATSMFCLEMMVRRNSVWPVSERCLPAYRRSGLRRAYLLSRCTPFPTCWKSPKKVQHQINRGLRRWRRSVQWNDACRHNGAVSCRTPHRLPWINTQ
ncbi:hypothetical protein F5Y13DRAFT_73814 [Hypoxylon sp. FL1857]|nr:hypothetical protein F5Y13DRAFT_73814 [Hypoxylon sp. FL1857]